MDQPGAGGCAFFSTKQIYEQDLRRFVEKTGYVMEQWLGRMAPVTTLPDDISQEDMLAVARINFPNIRPPYLKLIAAHAMRSEGLLHHIELVAKRAEFIAGEHRRAEPAREDVEQAIVEMLPHGARPATSAQPMNAAAAPPRYGSRPAAPQPFTVQAGAAAAVSRPPDIIPTAQAEG
jgi:hypothetical protein